MIRFDTSSTSTTVQAALKEGFTEEEARQGFCIAPYWKKGVSQVQKLDYPGCWFRNDREAAKAASMDGMTFIKDLPSQVPEGYYPNLPGNRKAIQEALDRLDIHIEIGEDGVCRQLPV